MGEFQHGVAQEPSIRFNRHAFDERRQRRQSAGDRAPRLESARTNSVYRFVSSSRLKVNSPSLQTARLVQHAIDNGASDQERHARRIVASPRGAISSSGNGRAQARLPAHSSANANVPRDPFTSSWPALIDLARSSAVLWCVHMHGLVGAPPSAPRLPSVHTHTLPRHSNDRPPLPCIGS
jgi:hypothetical protein